MDGVPPDYYSVLEIAPNATQQQVRDAYKRAALKSHPDRVPADSAERPVRTEKFQQVNDAYYTLSDPARRRDYDATRAFHGGTGSSQPTEDGPPPRSGGFPWSNFGFGGGESAEEEQRSQEQFGSVFEEMLREEGMAEGETAEPTSKFWRIIGGVSGGALGFIVANMPGLIAGGLAGGKLGEIRDKRGKSVYSVFQELPQNEKARLLSELAAKVLRHAVST